MITIIAAVSRNGVIGTDGDLPWYLPSDFKHFKETTKGHSVIMGRKTWDSLPKRPLPLRRNIVISRSEIDFPGAETASSVEEAVEMVGEAGGFIIGGGMIYEAALHVGLVDRMILTMVDMDAEGDVRFPEWDAGDFVEHTRNTITSDAVPFDIVEFLKA